MEPVLSRSKGNKRQSLEIASMKRIFESMAADDQIDFLKDCMKLAKVNSIVGGERAVAIDGCTLDHQVVKTENKIRYIDLRELFEYWFYPFACNYTTVISTRFLNASFEACQTIAKGSTEYGFFDLPWTRHPMLKGFVFEFSTCYMRLFDDAGGDWNDTTDEESTFVALMNHYPVNQTFLICFDPTGGRGFSYMSCLNLFRHVDAFEYDPELTWVLFYLLGYAELSQIEDLVKRERLEKKINHVWYRADTPPSPEELDTDGKFEYRNEKGEVLGRADKWTLSAQFFTGLWTCAATEFRHIFGYEPNHKYE